MKKQIVALLSVLLISPVFAEEVPSSEKIQLAQQLIKLDGSVAAVSSVKESMMQQIKQNLPPYIKADFFSILDEELNIQEILDKQQTVYARIFSKEEMQKSIAFYSTPEGKSIAQKMPQITQELMFASQQRMQDANERVMMLMQAKK